MDPTKNLEEQVEIANHMLDADDYVDSGDAVRLAELVVSLDNWIVKGGFPPKRWNKERQRR